MAADGRVGECECEWAAARRAVRSVELGGGRLPARVELAVECAREPAMARRVEREPRLVDRGDDAVAGRCGVSLEASWAGFDGAR